MPGDLILNNVRPMGGASASVEIRAGRILRVGPTPAAAQPGVETIDGGNRMLLPGLIDGHMHLDKTFVCLPWVPHRGGPTIYAKIEADKRVHREVNPSVAEQAKKLMRLAISKGTTHIRSHVDVDAEIGLSRLHEVMAAREALKEAVSVQLVAFPQSGVMRSPGTAALLEEAVRQGAELIGGVDPAGIDQDPKGQLDALFAIAERTGAGIDLHLHDPGELGVHQVRLIAERTRALGLGGKVVISHAYGLGTLDYVRMGEMAELLRECGIAIMTTGYSHTPVPPVQRLHDAGVTVFSGSDGVRDPWTPFGNADQLERAMLIAQRFDFRTDAGLELAFHLSTFGAAEALGIAPYGLEEGCPGDAVLVEAENVPDAVVSRPPRALVIKAGRIVARDGKALL